MANTTFAGNIGERIAAEYLEEKGYVILERNAKLCDCEVDIICEVYTLQGGEIVKQKPRKKLFNILKSKLKVPDMQNKGIQRTLIFCEVKTRGSNDFGSGAEAVTKYKVGRYVTAAKAYAVAHGETETDIRFDIIEVSESGINHIEGAFDTNDARYPKRKY